MRRSLPARFDPAGVSGDSILALGYLVLFGSMIAFTAYGWLLRHAPLSLVGTYAYVNPIVAVALGTVFLSEPIGPRTIVAAAVVLVAVAIIVSARGRLASASRRPAAVTTVRSATPEPARVSAAAAPPAPSGRPAAPSP